MKSLKLFCSFLLLITILCLQSVDLSAQRGNEFIYGKITTKSNEQYIGFMRWGKQELMWHDVFNSTKKAQKHKKAQEEKPSSLWDNFNWSLSSIWEDKYRQQAHVFSCFFGDIKAIYPKSSDYLDLELKNGTIINLEGGSDDVGTSVYVYDYELGRVKIKWSKIKKVEFSSGPLETDDELGQPLYGKLKTRRKGTLEGYIKWDLEERITEDILDGRGDQQIAFKNISSITKKDNGAKVTLHSGREVFLNGSNDVNNSNRGIAIFVDGVGNVEVSWKDFKHLELFENPNSCLGYNDFKAPVGIKANCYTVDDEELEGLIVFDVDEKWEIEFIDGNDDNVKYQIPIRYIERIVPKNQTYSQLYLKNGETILLGESQDVSYKNDGLLLFINGEEVPKLIDWKDIIEIKIK